MRKAIVLALALSATACSSWPDAVGGNTVGLARPPPRSTAARSVVERHVDCSLQRLGVLSQAAESSGRQTGRMALLETAATRAQREVADLLPDDADRTLEYLDKEMAALADTLHVETVSLRQWNA